MRSIIIILTLLFVTTSVCAEIAPVKFNCEEDSTVCWSIPDWTFDNDDYVGISSGVSPDQVSEGEKSLKIIADFPGDRWAAIMVGCEKNIDLTGYQDISADIYLPKGAVSGMIQARFVMTVGEWRFIENKNATMLKPGQWITIKAKIGGDKFKDTKYWKCQDTETCIIDSIDDIKSIGIRVEYNASSGLTGAPYKGPIYIDNIVIK